MSGEKFSYPYGYENVLLLKSESSLTDEEAEEKVILLTFGCLINLREFLQSFFPYRSTKHLTEKKIILFTAMCL